MKLQKQLRAYAKQIQDFTGERLHGERGGQAAVGLVHHPASRCGDQGTSKPRGALLGLSRRDLLQVPQPRAQQDVTPPCSSPPVKRETTGLGQEPAASQAAPSPPGLSQAMLAWRMEDEGRIIKAVITGRVWVDGDPVTQRSSLLPTRVSSPKDGLIPPTSLGQHPAPFSSL